MVFCSICTLYMLKFTRACVCGTISGRALTWMGNILVLVLRNHQSLLAFGTTFDCLVLKGNVR
jgi:hypothetical protein